MNFDFNDPIVSNIRKGTSDSPYQEYDEPLIIDKSGKVQLTEYPDKFHKVYVTGENKDWYETENNIPDVNSYKVDYEHKIVSFNIANVGKQLNFNYQGMGNSLISVANIYTERDGLGVTETLKSLTDTTKEARNVAIETNANIQNAEDIRITTENQRILDETTRLSNETTRESNESSRKNAETTRVANENARISNENERNIAETNRVNTEALRVTAEEIREQNEDNREIAETNRTSNETTRQSNESTRTSNENTRISNENARISDNANRLSLGDYNVTTQYKKYNEVKFNGSTWRALRDVKGVTPVEGADWTLVARKGTDGNGVIGIYKEVFIATEGQKTFTVQNRFDQFQNRTYVVVNGVSQKRPDNYEEISSNTISFYEGLPAGYRVEITYFEEAVPMTDDVRTVVNTHTDKISQHEVALSNKIESVIYEKFTSTANQSVFNLTNSYDVGKNRLKVYIEGILQTSPDNFTETSYKSFTLTESLPVGVKVLAEIYK